jgi:hypothetical protein
MLRGKIMAKHPPTIASAIKNAGKVGNRIIRTDPTARSNEDNPSAFLSPKCT